MGKISLKEEHWLASRKMWFAVGTSASIVIMGLLSARFETLNVSLAEVIGGLLGSLGLYITGNVTAKWAADRKPKDSSEAPSD